MTAHCGSSQLCHVACPERGSSLALHRIRWKVNSLLCVHESPSHVRLCNPKDCSPPGSSMHGTLQAKKYWSGLPFPSPGDLPDPGFKPRCPALQADSLPSELQGHPWLHVLWGISQLSSGWDFMLSVLRAWVQSPVKGTELFLWRKKLP